MTAIIDNWSDYYIARTTAVLDGSWKSTDTWGGMDAEMVHMAPLTNLPDDVTAMATETMAKIKAGELKPFSGPIMKQDGSVWLKEGESADDGTLAGLNFYVKGVDDKLPQ